LSEAKAGSDLSARKTWSRILLPLNPGYAFVHLRQ
jgi:hypothetical protein